MAYEAPRNESVTGVIGKVVDDVRELFREEMALARAEIRQEVSAFSTLVLEFAAGAVAGGFALSFLLLGVAQGFAMLVGWPVWAGYVAIAVLLGICAAAALYAARARARTVSAIPPRTVASLKETKAWIQDRMTSERR